MQVSPEKVFETLSDGWPYGLWVVGASHIRAVDEGWPAAGSRIHHSVGAWPLMLGDNTEVAEVDAPDRLVLTARAWPFGAARIVITLAPTGAGTTIRLDEAPQAGPATRLHNPLTEQVLRRRNIESLSRLATLVEHRRPRTRRCTI